MIARQTLASCFLLLRLANIFARGRDFILIYRYDKTCTNLYDFYLKKSNFKQCLRKKCANVKINSVELSGRLHQNILA